VRSRVVVGTARSWPARVKTGGKHRTDIGNERHSGEDAVSARKDEADTPMLRACLGLPEIVFAEEGLMMGPARDPANNGRAGHNVLVTHGIGFRLRF